MDNRPIAVFDSGLGGLTAVGALSRLYPDEDLIYFGDTGRVPYGTRSRKAILRFSSQAARFLMAFDPKALVIACGTASTAAMEAFDCGVPAVGVVEPSVRKAAAVTRNGRVGLLATPASVRTGAYAACMRSAAPHIALTERDGRLLVPLVEAGRVGPGDRVAALLIEEYCAPFRAAGVDTLILGCTHYPLLADLFAAALPGVTLVNAGVEAAEALRGLIIQADRERTGSLRFFVSDDAEGFSEQAKMFLQREITEMAEVVDLEENMV
ncbi:MAG: glutamate racemase [Oscillospiraceae bacterium]|jgi:glutamate racemase|nr:glutamate racemase [Oscillospiraceae bacterium]